MKVSYTMTNFTHMSGTPAKVAWNYASAIGVPVQYTDIDTASITGPRGRTLGTE
jgi:hypothetical protein